MVAERSGPKGPSKLTAELTEQIVALHATGLTLLQIAAQAAVSTATVRVALGRVAPRTAQPAPHPVEPGNPAEDDAGTTLMRIRTSPGCCSCASTPSRQSALRSR